MSISKEEMQIRIVEHISAILFYFMADDEMTQEEEDEMEDNTMNVAAIIASTMNIDVKSVETKDLALIGIELEDPVSFIKKMIA
jgi:sensor histidine kinase regulating citrate/malate metabolism